MGHWSDATEVMIGYVNSSYGGLTDTAMMDMPADWLAQAPMRYDYVSMDTHATINDGDTVPVTLIYTTGDTGGGCAGGLDAMGPIPSFGRIAVCGSDGPYWNGWAYSGSTWGIDRCSLGSTDPTWANCSSSRLFSIWAR